MNVAIRARARLGYAGQVMVLAVLYFLLGKLSFSLSVTHGIVTLVVFASEGVALGALILGGTNLWPGVFLGQFFLALSGGLPPWVALGISGINGAEAVLGATLFRRWGLDPRLERMSDVAALLMLITFLLQPFSAALGTTLLRMGGHLPSSSHGLAALSWWFGNLLGQFIFTPLLLTWFAPGQPTPPSLGRNLGGATLTLLVSVVVFGGFGPGLHNGSLIYAVFSPLLVAIAVQQGMPGATLSVLLVSAVVVVATHSGLGPFAARQGSENWIDLNLFLVGACLTSLFVAAIFAERARSEARAQRLADANLIGVAFFDGEDWISGANEAFLHLIGRPRKGLDRGELSWASVLPPKAAAARASRLADLREGKAPAPYESEVLHQNGTRIPVLLGTTLFQDGSGEGVAFVLDLSAAREQDRLKSEFVTLVSHELRTPLTSLLGSLGLLRGGAMGPLPKAVNDALDIAYRNTERLAAVVNDIVDLEKLSVGSMEFRIEPADLVQVVRRALEENQAYGRILGVSLDMGEAPEKAMVLCDVHRTLQVLANLLSNAVKFSPSGAAVVVHLRPREARVQVDVDDQGMGIPKPFQARLFQPFTQGKGTDARKPKGAGLGLSIAKSMVERMGGQIWFTSQEGRGSTFSFDLPTPGNGGPAPPSLSS